MLEGLPLRGLISATGGKMGEEMMNDLLEKINGE
jgi:hypothetical protein